ncbi:MAG TPA: tetratricopeptide repeat protein [Fluviicoccus sp.]|nr:tetratricopeptide repeat protein [Fluviicoccus sp.]
MMNPTYLFRLSPLAAALILGACSSLPENGPSTVSPASANLSGGLAPAGQATPAKPRATLANLDSVTINIPKMDDQLAVARVQLQKVEAQTLANTPAQPTVATPAENPEPSKPLSLDDQVNEKLNESLYRQILEQAKKAPDPGTANAYLQVARKLKMGNARFAAEKEEQKLLQDSVDFYKDLLKRMPTPEARAEIYYDLAKTYDLMGNKAESAAALRELAQKYPKTPFLTEVHFRLAEEAFAANRFTEAAGYYQKVLDTKDSGFHDSALYKRGWALYRSSNFEDALPLFFRFAEKIMVKPRKTKQEEAKLQDSYDVISLCFMMMDGPKSVDEYFTKNGEKFFESGIYANLAQAYLAKRQFSNAAETYSAFINRHPFDPSAPELSTAIINIYQQGGFPAQVILAKEEFIKHYNPEGSYWKQADEATRTRLRPILEGHIVDLAKHYHALAQMDNNEGDYLKAATWYRMHLAMQPAEQDAIAINQLLAEALYSAKHYAEAIPEFEKTAYGYNNPKGAEAAAFGLVSYQDWDKSLEADEAARLKLIPARVAAVLKFADKFPQDPNTPKLLQGMIQLVYERWKDADDTSKQLVKDLEGGAVAYTARYPQDPSSALLLQGMTNLHLHFKDYDGSVRTAQMLLAINPPVAEALRLEAAGVVADAQFDQGQFAEAEKSYQQVMAFNIPDAKLKARYQDRLATTYYRQAEKLRDDKKPEEAASFFQKAAQASSDTKIKTSSDFDAAAVLLNGEKYKEAIPVLLSFKQRYPDSPLSVTIPEKLALAYEKSGDIPNAAAQYEAIAARDQKKSPQAAREALWLAAEMYEKGKQPDAALRIYKQYAGDPANPADLRGEATFKLYTSAVSRQQVPEQNAALKSLAQLYEKQAASASPRIRYFGALANFKLSQPAYDAFVSTPIKQPLKQSILLKKKAMQSALAAYNKVAAIGVAEFTTAANYQQGEIYRLMANDLVKSERPKGLSDLELEQYTILLEEQAEPLSDKAIAIHTINTDLVKQEVYDSYVQKSFDALAELSPGRYNKREQLEDSIDEIY